MKNTIDIIDAPVHDQKTDYNFIVGPYFSPQFKIVGAVFIVAGISLCFQMNAIGLVLIGLGLTAVLAKKVLTVSFSLSRYRYTFAILKYRVGSWKTLPEFESISIFSTKKSQDMQVGSQSITASYSEIDVNLVYNNSRRLTIFSTKNYSNALEIATEFAEKFQLKIYDATQREGKWL